MNTAEMLQKAKAKDEMRSGQQIVIRMMYKSVLEKLYTELLLVSEKSEEGLNTNEEAIVRENQEQGMSVLMAFLDILSAQ